MLSFWEQRFVTVAVLLGLALVNVRGVRWGGGLQLIITTVKVASLLAILVLPFLFWQRLQSGPSDMVVQAPPGTFTWGGFGTALLGVLWAYHGWMNIAPVAEEVRQPQRNIPLAFLAGTGTIIFLYLGANLAYHLVIPHQEMAALPEGTIAVAEFGLRLLGPIGVVLASAAVMCSVFGALNGNLLVGPRLLYAMGEDGMAPRCLGAVHPHYRTPALAILVMATWAMILVVAAGAVKHFGLPILEIGEFVLDVNPPADKHIFDTLTDFAMFGAVIFETLAVATIFVFRQRLPDATRPYRCPGYPVVPALYMILPAFILGNMFVYQQVEALVGLSFIGMGALVYFKFLSKPWGESSSPRGSGV